MATMLALMLAHVVFRRELSNRIDVAKQKNPVNSPQKNNVTFVVPNPRFTLLSRPGIRLYSRNVSVLAWP
jgi:hypothetical protein